MLGVILWLSVGFIFFIFVNYYVPYGMWYKSGSVSTAEENAMSIGAVSTLLGPLSIIISVTLFITWYTTSTANRETIRNLYKSYMKK